MRNLAICLLLSAAALLGGIPIHAQSGPSTGSRVRVSAPSIGPDLLTGTVAAASKDSLRLAVARGTVVLTLDKRALESLEVSRGRSRLQWALLGAGLGMLGGSLLGAELGGHNDPSGFGALVGSLTGATLGLPVGAVGGALLAPERWNAYPLPRGPR